MSRCLIAALLCISCSAFGQTSRRVSNFQGIDMPVNLHDRSGLAKPAEQPQFIFEIRMCAVTERVIEATLDQPAVLTNELPEGSPFDGWRPNEPGKLLQLRSFETHVKLPAGPHDRPKLIELSDKQIFNFIQAAQGDNRSNVMQAPRLTVYCEQVGEVHDDSTVAFIFTDEDAKEHRSTAIQGTRIYVRATRREDGEIEADVKIELHALPNRDEIPLTDDATLSRPPEQTVTTMNFSGILRGEKLNMALIPSSPTVEPKKPKTLIERATFHRREPQPTTIVIPIVSVCRLKTPE